MNTDCNASFLCSGQGSGYVFVCVCVGGGGGGIRGGEEGREGQRRRKGGGGGQHTVFPLDNDPVVSCVPKELLSN